MSGVKDAGVVTSIKFEIVVDGNRAVAEFVDTRKIRELMRDDGSLGSFLRDMKANVAANIA
jgi:hypothetical protein